ncbi:MAG: phospholipid carrier-dependent glycosyltransferase, partial [Chloroflexi bacterium]|nr:phospholipid carrier-dependent glycosyltransferase [Chloroflexota bacterium]
DLFTARSEFRVLTTGVIAVVTAALAAAPFGLSFIGLLQQVGSAAAGYPYVSVNAYNPWALLEMNGGGIAADSRWIRDVNGGPGELGFMFGPVPAVIVGTTLLLLVIAAVMVAVARRPDRLAILVGVTVLAVAFFVVPTRVHERYMYPFFGLAAILAVVSARWLLVYFSLSVASFLNLYVVITTLYPDNPGISDWLGIGQDIKAWPGVAVIALVHLAGFVWVAGQLRGGATERLAAHVHALAERARARAVPAAVADDLRWQPDPILEPVPVATAATGRGPAARLCAPGPPLDPRDGKRLRRADWLTAPAVDQPGLLASVRRGLFARPRRADRTGLLARESGGRFDRLDAWVLIVLVVATLGLRTFRLAEPYSMHFDEVYHARTATEFLQHWRYGQPHSIYEYTHPHLAKYAMAAGVVAFGNNAVTGTSQLGVPVRAAAIELRWDDPSLPGGRAGDRVYVATGTEVRAYDLADRALEATIAIRGASALAVDQSGHRLFIGTDEGRVLVVDTSLQVDALRISSDDAPLVDTPISLATVGAPVAGLLAPSSGDDLIITTASNELIAIDASSGEIYGRVVLPGLLAVEPAGSANQVTADPALLADAAAAAAQLAELLGGEAAEFESRLTSGAASVIIGPAPTGSARTALDEAIADGRLAGVGIESIPLIAAVDAQGLTFLSSRDAGLSSQLELPGATGLAYVTGLDHPRLYVAAGDTVAVVRLADASSGREPHVDATLTAPGVVTDVVFDASANFVHVLGRTPDGSTPTIYVVEPHGNAFFADARLTAEPAAWVIDAQPRYPSQDRQAILAFSAAGAVDEVDAGSNPFAWRLPGVVAGALLAGLLFVLARILFRRRSVALFAAVFVLADAMMFVQTRIGMNDVYVALFIVTAYTLFAALWTGILRGRRAFWWAMPVIGLLLGLGLASKWVALYAVAGLGVLTLARSALGRLLIVIAMIGATTVLGYMAINVPQGATSGGNVFFVLLMIGLTLVAVLAAVLRPVAWTPEEVRFAVAGPVVAGVGLLALTIPLGLMDASIAVSGIQVSPLTIAGVLALLGGAVAIAFWAAGRFGFGPLASPLPPGLGPPLAAPPPSAGWLRLGSGWGIPAIWLAICLGIIPIAVYVVSYLPWVALGNRLTEGWPAANTGQSLIDLTKSMYDYHNNLRAAHAAASPWWAWPLDLKPVWFYQGSFAGNTSASIYDAGNLVVWWLGIPAMAFCAWQAWKRQSLALALVVVGFAFQWLTWVRIDRATFQYHYFTGLPFVILGLGYFVAELWHGPSRGTWLLARVAAALAIVAPALLWVGKGPLCRFVRVEAVNPGSQACVGNPGDLVVTARVAGLVLVMGVAIVLLIYQVLRLQRGAGRAADDGRGSGARAAGAGDGEQRRLLLLVLTGIAAWIGIVAVSTLLGETVVYEARGFQSSYVALLVAIPLAVIAAFVITARDARRFAMGVVFAAAMAFLVLYPNISALPLPSTVVNAYQGLLPTYLYPFQFPVNTDPAAPSVQFLAAEPILLFIALTVTSFVVGYAAWVWRFGPAPLPPRPDGLAPAEGGS